ncbi:MAG: hypothetical protein ACRC46_03640 [Thermoguttaceae bacterium]
MWSIKGWAMCLAVLAFCLGCGGRNYNQMEFVEGTVTLDGVPVADADITFQPITFGVGESATGRTDAQGVYKLSSMTGAPGKGTVAAEYAVTASKFVTTALDKPYVDMKQDALITHESKEMLPSAYTEVDFSPLTATVTKGKNVIDIKLESKVVPKKKMGTSRAG